MTLLLEIVSTVLTLASVIPYLIAIVKGNTKPRIVSWFTWSLLTGIAAVACWSDGQYPAAILMVSTTIETMAVVVLGYKYGDRTFERLDVMCQLGALAGIILWLVFDSPAVAVMAAIGIDFVGAVPSIKHCWQKPYEETWITFLLSSIGGAATVLAAGSSKITAIAYPLYIAAANAVFTVIIVLRLRRAVPSPSEPDELRAL